MGKPRHFVSLYKRVLTDLRKYTTKGSPEDRVRKVAIMLEFVEFAEDRGVNHLEELGARHVVKFWRHLRATNPRADKTLGDYHRALRALWAFYNRPESDVPKPWTRVETAARDARVAGALEASAVGGGQCKKKAPQSGRPGSQGDAGRPLGEDARPQVSQRQLALVRQAGVIRNFLATPTNASRIDQLGQEFRGLRKAVAILTEGIERELNV